MCCDLSCFKNVFENSVEEKYLKLELLGFRHTSREILTSSGGHKKRILNENTKGFQLLNISLLASKCTEKTVESR